MNDHEGFHFKDYEKNPQKYLDKSKNQRELDAIEAQMAHPTWSKTTQQYRDIISIYEKANTY